MGDARTGTAALRRRARWLAQGEAPGPRSLSVDAFVAGASGAYTHWRGGPDVPDPLADDSAAGILARAAADPARWLDTYDEVVNDHIDADGLIALALAVDPALAPHAPLLVDAAEAGDFCRFPGEAGFRLMLRLHQLMRDERARGSGWEQRCIDTAVGGMRGLIADSTRSDAERDGSLAAVVDAIARIERGDGIDVVRDARLSVVSWRARLGHPSDCFGATRIVDDVPPWALTHVLPETSFQLLAMAVDGGTIYQLDAPRHSWARTVRRPVLEWPDLTALARSLQAQETGSCIWVARPDAARVGFVCQLASGDRAGGVSPSRSSPDLVVGAVRAALGPR